MTKPELLQEFYEANKKKTDFLVLVIDIGNNNDYEYIFVPQKDFENKRKYIINTYDGQLNHKISNDIKIVDTLQFNHLGLQQVLPHKEV